MFILQSDKFNRYYIGYTADFETRFNFHLNLDEKWKFTDNVNDWANFIKIECKLKTQDLDIENHIKKMKSKVYIENLLVLPEMINNTKH